MWPFLWIAGLLSESVEVVQQALVDERALSAAERAHARLGLGMLAFGQGDYERAAPALETAIELCAPLGDVRHKATALVPLGVIQAVWDPNGGEDLLVQATDAFRELDDQWGLAFASLNLGGALLLHHRYADAIPHLEESLQHAREVKADVLLSNALINLGWVHYWLGDLEAARARSAKRSSTLRCQTTVKVWAGPLRRQPPLLSQQASRNSPRPYSARLTVSAARSERGSG